MRGPRPSGPARLTSPSGVGGRAIGGRAGCAFPAPPLGFASVLAAPVSAFDSAAGLASAAGAPESPSSAAADFAALSAAGFASAFGFAPSALAFAPVFAFAPSAFAFAPALAFAARRAVAKRLRGVALFHARGSSGHAKAGLLENLQGLLRGDPSLFSYLVDALLCHSVMKSKVSCCTITGARKARASGRLMPSLAAHSGLPQT